MRLKMILKIMNTAGSFFSYMAFIIEKFPFDADTFESCFEWLIKTLETLSTAWTASSPTCMR